MTAPDRSSGLTTIVEQRTELVASLPSDSANLWDWCLERSRDELLDTLAFIAGLSVSLLRVGLDEARGTHRRMSTAIAETVDHSTRRLKLSDSSS